MTNPLIIKLSFDGYHVTYWNHESHYIHLDHFPTTQLVMQRGWEKAGEPFPDLKTFISELYENFGDVVGKVVDNQGAVLYDRIEHMNETRKRYSTR